MRDGGHVNLDAIGQSHLHDLAGVILHRVERIVLPHIHIACRTDVLKSDDLIVHLGLLNLNFI